MKLGRELEYSATPPRAVSAVVSAAMGTYLVENYSLPFWMGAIIAIAMVLVLDSMIDWLSSRVPFSL